MRDAILKYIISNLLIDFLRSLNPAQLKNQLDNIIDSVEFQIGASENQYDDALLPVLKFARDFFAIPDLPDN